MQNQMAGRYEHCTGKEFSGTTAAVAKAQDLQELPVQDVWGACITNG